MRKIPLSSIVALIAIAFFCVCLTLAIVSYPPPFSPLENWMSDLGNPELNQAGALYFNAGCIITGFLLIVFYLGLQRLRNMGGRTLAVAQALGVFSGIALMGVGCFPETYEPHHFIVSVLFFVPSTLAVLLATLALRKYPWSGRATALAGYLAAAIGIVFAAQMTLSPGITIVEWMSVFSMLLWAALASLAMARMPGRQALYQSAPIS